MYREPTGRQRGQQSKLSVDDKNCVKLSVIVSHPVTYNTMCNDQQTKRVFLQYKKYQ